MEKCLAVIASCKTLEQWKGASSYVRLYWQRFGWSTELARALDKKLGELYGI